MYKKVSGSVVVLLVLWVDDILTIGSNVLMLQSFNIYWLSKFFSMKDLGEATYILGI